MVALDLTMLTPSDLAAHAALTPSLQDEQRGDDSAIDQRIIKRELGLFRSTQVPLRRAIEIAEALHASSKTMDISFNGRKEAHQAVDNHVYNRVRNFLCERHKVPGRYLG